MSFSIKADPFESPTVAIGCTAHYDTDSIHVVKSKMGIYEEEGGTSILWTRKFYFCRWESIIARILTYIYYDMIKPTSFPRHFPATKQCRYLLN